MSNPENAKKTKTSKRTNILTLQTIGMEPMQDAVSPKGFAVYVRALLQNWRQGTVGSKGRADVSRTNKKPFKQKGTGRARAGTARSPLWRGGGVTFGPQERTKKLSIPRKQKHRVLKSITNQYLQNNKVLLADWSLKDDKPKTAFALALLKDLGIADKKVTLLLANNDILTYASFSNLPNVRMMYFDQPNAFELARSDYWVVLNKDVDSFKQMVATWR